MSITDELRKWAEGDVLHAGMSLRTARDQALAIADRIDAEHEETIQRVLMGEGGVPATDENMAEYGWMRLPKDADGVPIHVGDVMESKGSDFLFDEASFEVRSMRCDECGWEVYDRLGDRYAPSLLCHHHAPTVEDVLREFVQAMNENVSLYVGEAIDADEWRSADNKTVAEFAARLELREVDE